MLVHKVDVEVYQKISENSDLLVVLEEKPKVMTEVIKLHLPATIDFWTKLHGYPSEVY